MGITAARQTAQGHNARLQRGFCAKHHRKKASRLRTVQPGPEGEDEEDRLPKAG